MLDNHESVEQDTMRAIRDARYTRWVLMGVGSVAAFVPASARYFGMKAGLTGGQQACSALISLAALLPLGMGAYGRWRGWQVGQYSPSGDHEVGQEGYDDEVFPKD